LKNIWFHLIFEKILQMKTILTTICLFTITILCSQNVGINEPNPTGRLHVTTNSTLYTPQLRLTEIGDDYTRIKLDNDIHLGAFWDIAGKSDTITDNSKLNFFFKNAINSGDRMTITGIGNVGIGTTNPLSKLDIKSISDGAELLRFTTDRPWVFKQTDSGINTRLTLQSTVGDKVFEIVGPDSTIVVGAFKANDIAPRAYLVPTIGRVGIGTDNPAAKVSIAGNPNSTENLINMASTYTGNFNITGVDCNVYPADGFGVGANFRGGHRGLRGLSDGQASTGTSIGVVGTGYGIDNVGTRIGVHGAAYGGEKNWAGYFKEGNVYITNELRIGAGAVDGATGYKVAIDGKVIAEELRINLSQAWPDYVFAAEYDLMPLEELKNSIDTNKHLPGIPSADEIKADGLIIGDMQTKMMEKIEELTLYIIQLNTELREVKSELNVLKKNSK
jgi:hypothetical protein